MLRQQSLWLELKENPLEGRVEHQDTPNQLLVDTQRENQLVFVERNPITVPKVGILNICSGFRWTAVLESVQRNSLTNAITLQSIPLFWRFFCSEFRCKALDSTIKYLKHSDLAVDSTKHCHGFH